MNGDRKALRRRLFHLLKIGRISDLFSNFALKAHDMLHSYHVRFIRVTGTYSFQHWDLIMENFLHLCHQCGKAVHWYVKNTKREIVVVIERIEKQWVFSDLELYRALARAEFEHMGLPNQGNNASAIAQKLAPLTEA